MRKLCLPKREEHDYLSLGLESFTLKVVETALQLSLKGSNFQSLL